MHGSNSSSSNGSYMATTIGSTYAFDFGLGVGSKQSSNVPLAQQKMGGLAQKPNVSMGGLGGSSGKGSTSIDSHLSVSAAEQRPKSGSGTMPTAGLGDGGVFGGWTSIGTSTVSPGKGGVGNVGRVGTGPGAGLGSGLLTPSIGIVANSSSSRSDDPFASLLGGGGGSGGGGKAGLQSMNGVRRSSGNDTSTAFGMASMASSLPRTTPPSAPLGGDPFTSILGGGGASKTPATARTGETGHVGGATSFEDPFSLLGRSTAVPTARPSSPLFSDGFSSFHSASAAVASSPMNFASFPSVASTSVQGDTFGGGVSTAQDDWGAFSSSKSAVAEPTASTLDGFDAVFGTPAPKQAAKVSAQGQGGDDWGVSWNSGPSATGGASNSTPVPTAGPPLNVTSEDAPPPPAGVNWRIAKEKGEEFYKGGQFGDAIEWLGWARQLAAAAGQKESLVEVLVKRASALKEAGEYKKAVADCSLAFEFDSGNTAVLMQRAVLYEAMEKYKLGAADMKEVVKRDPSNRTAVNLLNRLNKAVIANG